MSRAPSGRFRPPKELIALRERLAELFDAGGGTDSEKKDAAEAAMRWMPGLDVVADAQTIVVMLELPGMRAEDVSLELDGRVLNIRGQRTRGRDGLMFHRVERPMGPFERQIDLQGAIGHVEAELANGVLTLRMQRINDEPHAGRRTVVIRRGGRT